MRNLMCVWKIIENFVCYENYFKWFSREKSLRKYRFQTIYLYIRRRSELLNYTIQYCMYAIKRVIVRVIPTYLLSWQKIGYAQLYTLHKRRSAGFILAHSLDLCDTLRWFALWFYAKNKRLTLLHKRTFAALKDLDFCTHGLTVLQTWTYPAAHKDLPCCT